MGILIIFTDICLITGSVFTIQLTEKQKQY